MTYQFLKPAVLGKIRESVTTETLEDATVKALSNICHGQEVDIYYNNGVFSRYMVTVKCKAVDSRNHFMG